MDTLTIIMLSQQQPRAALVTTLQPRHHPRAERPCPPTVTGGSVWCPICIVACDAMHLNDGWEWALLYGTDAVCYCCGSLLDKPWRLT